MDTFDPKETSMIVGGKILSGFMDGTYITVERNEQLFNLKVGVDGEAARAKNNNRSGKFTITLLQTSESNDDLSGFFLADEASSTGAVPVLLKDSSGRTVCSCVTGWVQKPANVELAKEIVGRQWVLETDELLMFVAGN